MAKTERLGITLPEDSTNVTTQFFIDRFKEIDNGAESPRDSQLKVDNLKKIIQNLKITADDGTPLIKLKAGQDFRDEMVRTTPFFAVVQAELGVTSVPEGVFLQGIKLFSSPTTGFAIVQTKTNHLYVIHCQSGVWSKWFRMDDGERIFISTSKLATWDNIEIGKFYFLGTTMKNMPIANDASLYTLDVEMFTDNNLVFKQFTLRRNNNNRMWIGSIHEGVFSGWKEVNVRGNNYEVIFSGDTTGNFTTTFSLTKSLTDFDFIYVETISPSGFTNNDLFHVSGIKTADNRELIIEGQNIADDVGLDRYSLTELGISFDTTYSKFTQIRCIQLTITGVSKATRIENANTMGVKKIIGIRL